MIIKLPRESRYHSLSFINDFILDYTIITPEAVRTILFAQDDDRWLRLHFTSRPAIFDVLRRHKDMLFFFDILFLWPVII